MDKNKKIVLSLIFTVLIIIGILIIILVNNKKDKNSNIYYNGNWTNENATVDNNNILVAEEQKVQYSLKVKNVDIVSNYFTVQAIAEKYILLMMTSNKDELQNIIAPSYIKKYNINNNNILNIADIPKSDNPNHETFLSDIKECINSDKVIYFVNGKGILLNNNKMFNYKIMIELDTVKQLYIIYPEKFLIDNSLNNINVGDSVNQKYFEDIEDNQNNKFTYKKELTDSEIAKKYIYDFKNLLIYDRESAYSHLDSNYSKLRFGNRDSFNNYYEDNKIILAMMNVNKYKVENNDKYKDYIVVDKYNNIYRIRQLDGIMNYSVFLDNYTIQTENELNKYSKAKVEEKAKLNLNKVINMINTKDYNSIYKVLNPTFRESNFKSVNDLRIYIQKNFYEINSIKIDKAEKKNNYYVFKCITTNQRNVKESKSVNIIISKTQDTNFEMSFSF